MTSTATRQTADERREAVLKAAATAFARGGLHGTSTEDIATVAGISQPYLFRLFGTKKALYVATVERCMAETLEIFRAASRDLRGEAALWHHDREAWRTHARADDRDRPRRRRAHG